MSCDMSFDGCLIGERTLVFDVCGKREWGVIRSIEDLDVYIFEFGMPNKVVFKNFDMAILEQEFEQIIKGACYNVEAYEFPKGFEYVSDGVEISPKLKAMLDGYISGKGLILI